MKKKLRIIQLSALIFLTISGGPYGLESLLSYVGNNGALLLLFITPIIWDLPAILTVLELNSLMPVTGGYYQWVKRAMGLRFAWYEGWWTWLYTFVDLAIYPVLFMEYLTYFFPEAESFKIPICLIIIWASAYLNIRGIILVGKTAVILGIAVLVPFFLLFYYFITHHSVEISSLSPSLQGIKFSAVGLGLYTIMWNFLGWDNVTTYAEEVAKPIRAYLISVVTAFVTIFIVYFMVIIISIQSGIDHNELSSGGFPVLGELVGGKWLGALIAIGGMASGLGLYASVLLSVSRVPQAMSEDKLLPKKLHILHRKYQTPHLSIIWCTIIVSFMIVLPFSDLIIMDVIIYGAALFLEFASLIILRIKKPNSYRPFKIPFNVTGLILMICLPIAVYVIALVGAIMNEGNTIRPIVISLSILFSAEIIWQIIIWRRPNLLKQLIHKEI
ncbi:APC family permease [Aurantibacillus circumpalustris]|uniref:APC family permease n=1 Tax=Aurantibacillus circumpalustris TaxID=3036359 RepID=UPI00295AACCB|nr:APC family permease [Aurantibacillus circumpalustris]